jgi:hypothetical protein
MVWTLTELEIHLSFRQLKHCFRFGVIMSAFRFAKGERI